MIVGIRLHAYLCGGLDDELEKTYPQGRRGCASGCPSCKDDVPRYLDCSALQWALAMALPGGRKFLDVGPLRRLGITDLSAEALEFVVLATITYNEIRFEDHVPRACAQAAALGALKVKALASTQQRKTGARRQALEAEVPDNDEIHADSAMYQTMMIYTDSASSTSASPT